MPMKLFSASNLFSTFLLALSLLFTACNPQSMDTPNRIPKSECARNFEAINQHLDLGGPVYGYIDAEGDIAQLIKNGSAFLEKMRAAEPGMVPDHINFQTIVERFALQQIEGIGVSSYRMDNRFRNKTFLYAPGKPQGLLKVFLGENGAFQSVAVAPTGADLLFEKSVNAVALRELIFAIAQDVVGDEGPEMLRAQLEQPIGGVANLTAAKIIDSLNTRMVVVVDINPSQSLTIQDTGVTLQLNAVDFYISVDNLGWLVDDLAGTFGMMPQLTFANTASSHTITSNLPLPQPWDYYKPVIRHDLQSKQLILASSQAFLDRCSASASAILTDPAFKEATKGLAMEGSYFKYVSPTVGQFGRKVIEQMMAQQNDETVRSIFASYEDMLPSANYGTASSAQLLPEGYLLVSNSETSHKSNLSLLAANPVTIGLLAAIAVPAFNKVRERTLEEQAMLNEMEYFEAEVSAAEEEQEAGVDGAKLQPDSPQALIEDRKKLIHRIKLTGASSKGALINGSFTKVGRYFYMQNERFKLLDSSDSVITIEDADGNVYTKRI